MIEMFFKYGPIGIEILVNFLMLKAGAPNGQSLGLEMEMRDKFVLRNSVLSLEIFLFSSNWNPYTLF